MSVDIDISACCPDSFLENCCCPCQTPNCNATPPSCGAGSFDYTFSMDMATACANNGVFPSFSFQVPVKPCRVANSNTFDLSGMVRVLYRTQLRGRNHATIYKFTMSLTSALPSYPSCSLYVNVTDSLSGGGATHNMGNGTTPLILTFGPANSNPTNACIDGGFSRVCIVAKVGGSAYACCPDASLMLNVQFDANVGSGAGAWSGKPVCCQPNAFPSLFFACPPSTTPLSNLDCNAGLAHGFLPGSAFACIGVGANCGVNCNDTAPSTLSSVSCGTNTCSTASCTGTRFGPAGTGCCANSGPPFTCPPGGVQANQCVQYNFSGTCPSGVCEGACC